MVRRLALLLAAMLSVAPLFGLTSNRPHGALPDAPEQEGPYKGCVKVFNGNDFEGWEADPSTWSIVDGAMRGVGGTSRLAYTKADYGSFRLIFTARMNPVNGDHLGVLFWGDRPQDRSRPKIDNAGWIQFMPPHGAMWDYHPPKHHNLPHETLAPGSRDFTKWSTTELLCNLEKGTMRAAVNGVEIARYTHAHPGERTDPEKRIVSGPIGMFRHGGGASEYKDIYVEANPKDDTLLTVQLSKAEEEVRKLEREWLDAYEKFDVTAMDRIVADDFTITFPNGAVQRKPQLLTSLKAPRNPNSPPTRFFTEDVRSRAYGDTVILIGTVVTESHRDGKPAQTRSRYTDTYVKRDGRWQVAASHLSALPDPPRRGGTGSAPGSEG